MNFRYFKLTGQALKAYLSSEATEMEQRNAVTKALLKDRDDIESYRPSRTGGIVSILFKEGMQPEGFVRASKNLPPDEVRPHGKSKIAKPWRELLKSLHITENCQKNTRSLLDLPTFIIGNGMRAYSSRIGHVGEDVFVEVPDKDNSFVPMKDLVEVKNWEFVKACEEAVNYEYNVPVFTIKAR